MHVKENLKRKKGEQEKMIHVKNDMFFVSQTLQFQKTNVVYSTGSFQDIETTFLTQPACF